MKKIMFLLITAAAFLLVSCQEKPQPDDRLKEYIGLWNKQNFEKMYDDYLATTSTETYMEEDFTDRYKNLYDDLGVKNVKVSYKEPKDEKEWDDKKKVKLPIRIQMDTVAGKIDYEKKVTLTREEREETEDWFVEWNPSFILPNLQQGDKVRLVNDPAIRGEIYDRNDLPLAINGESYEVGVVPQEFNPDDLGKLSQLLELTPEYIEKQMNQPWVKPDLFVPLKKVPLTQQKKAQEMVSIPGVRAPKTEAREYPFAEATAHLIGHTGTITAEKLEKLKDKGYTKADRIGIRGVEQLYEEKLRGKNGIGIYIAKGNGDVVTAAEIPKKDGETIKLTIDAEMQKTLYGQMKGEAGAASIINPATGEVLSLLSSPSFDPNEFELGISSKNYKQLDDNPKKPLLNRFTIAYAPGSTMKAITSSVLLKNGFDPEKVYRISGKQWQKDASWGNYKVTRVNEHDETVDLESAIKLSDNIYFAQAALELGADKFISGLKEFGFGEELPFNYPLTPSQVSNDGKIKSDIQLADSSFGQGEVLMSVLHLASSYSVIVNEGTMMEPVLLFGEKEKEWKTDLLSKEDAQLLKKNLRKVVTEGTAKKAAVEGMEIAGKTGTAEIKSKQGTTGTENGSFVSYDQKDPAMVVAMLVENVHNRGGSNIPVEMTRKFYENW
ncbi:penicillin-binding transpeptidase domain-containing protein [Bacillus sp. REN3]|uniref:penicillin-binding transpeptidase domain-containing protein n=1 Tax=Bacillus sp. REN3 TaxID=2802440 RepID=UPI001AED7F7A|nr:penicillin-binding transpeptidase domain-containing protein [Bacillus sp. REN3]